MLLEIVCIGAERRVHICLRYEFRHVHSLAITRQRELARNTIVSAIILHNYWGLLDRFVTAVDEECYDGEDKHHGGAA